ncbi:MAG TPA: zinc-binding dehydrogenase [Gemmatimonadales bacterium]
MKALVLDGHGGLEQLRLADVPAPTLIRPIDVRVRLKAGSLNHLDLWTMRGLPGLELEFPHIVGGDGAGVVDAVGADVRHVRPGDAVIFNPGISCYQCEFCLAGNHSLCIEYKLLGEHLPGTLAEYIVVPGPNVALLPTPPAPAAPYTWPEAAAFSLASLTAWRMLITRARVRPGETVLIWGIGGGVSGAALQIAKLAGAFVIATSSSDEKLERARGWGADVTFNHQSVDVVKEVRALTAKRGVDVVVENVGEATWDQSLRVLGRGARLVTCGATTGPHVTIDIRRLFWFQWDILGSTMGGAEDYREVVRLLGRGLLRPLVDSVHAFDDAVNAVRRLEAGSQMGKVVVEI